MSEIYKALHRAGMESAELSTLKDSPPGSPDLFQAVLDENSWLEQAPVVQPVGIPENRVVTITDQNSLGTEKFRLLQARLRRLQDRGSMKTIVITSGASGEGKTTVALNLALSLARHSSQKILLLEGDLRHPALENKLGLVDLRGLGEWFGSQEPLTGFIYRIEAHQLWFLPAGKPAEDALRILQSDRLTDAMNRLTGCFDWIVIDSPPLTPLADIHLWVLRADGVLLVIRDGLTRKQALVKGLKDLESERLVGVVHNDASSASRSYHPEYYRLRKGASGDHKR
jgi:capsular exopolysaccharide synthesis family protein